MNQETINKEAKNMTNEELKQKVYDIRNNQIVEMIIRQTDYTKEEAIEKLKKHNNNYLQVLKEYMNYEKVTEKKEESKSLNQNIYSNIRNFLDDSIKEKARQSQIYNKIKEQKEAYEKAKREKSGEKENNKTEPSKEEPKEPTSKEEPKEPTSKEEPKETTNIDL